MTIKCDVYKSARKANTYLYLEAGVPHDELPDALQSLLGELSQFLRLDLNPESKLAQVKPEDVITSIKEQGYFLQMPPGELSQTQLPAGNFIQ